MINGKIFYSKQKWMKTKIGDICINPQYGWTTSAIEKGKIQLIRTTDITSGVINWDTVPFCGIEPDEINKYLIKEGDILISRAGSVGFSCLVQSPKKAVFASYLIRFRPLIDKKYFYYFLKSPSYWESIGKKKIGIAVPNVNASKLKQIEIPLVSLPEQHRIVSKIEELFTKLDAGVENLKKIQKEIKRYRQAVLKHAFEGKLTEEWRKANKDKLEPASELLKKIKEERKKALGKKYKELPPINKSDLPQLPEGWEWTRIGETNYINPRLSNININDSTTVTFLPMKSVEEETGKADTAIKKKYKEVKKGYTYFIDGDVLFAKITPCMENGKVTVVNNLENGIGFGSTEFHVIRVISKEIVNKYIFFYVVREKYRREAKSNMSGAVGQLRVPTSFVEESYFPLPCFPEQHKIVEEIELLFSVADEVEKIVEKSLKESERLRQSILKIAFEGRLVPQDPNDEPAEKLLERIRVEREQQQKISKKKSGRR